MASPLRSLRRLESIFGDDIADPDPPARPQHPADLCQHRRLVGGQVDHTVGDDHVDRVCGQGDLLDQPLQEVHVSDTRFTSISAGEGEHLIGHVQPVGSAGLTDPLRREDHVDAAARAQVEYDLALVQVGNRGRVPTTKRREHSRVGQLAALLDVIQRLAECAWIGVGATAAAATPTPVRALIDRSRRFGVAATNLLAQIIRGRHQQHAPFRSTTAESFSTAAGLRRSTPICPVAPAPPTPRPAASSCGGRRSAARAPAARPGGRRTPAHRELRARSRSAPAPDRPAPGTPPRSRPPRHPTTSPHPVGRSRRPPPQCSRPPPTHRLVARLREQRLAPTGGIAHAPTTIAELDGGLSRPSEPQHDLASYLISTGFNVSKFIDSCNPATTPDTVLPCNALVPSRLRALPPARPGSGRSSVSRSSARVSPTRLPPPHSAIRARP